MSDQSEDFPLVETHRDGAVFAKVWRNFSREGEPFYSVTLGRTYTDPESGLPRESASFQGTDILKAQSLLGDAYKTVSRERTLDRQHSRQAEAPPRPSADMREQRDQAVNGAKPAQSGTRRATRSRRRAPEQ